MNLSFDPILEVSRLMHGFPGPWFVSGGWAIDLFLGRLTRAHSDIEIGIYRSDQQAIWGQLPVWILEKAVSTPGGGKWIRWENNEELTLPIHQIRARLPHDVAAEFEFFLNERTETHWASRRHPNLVRPLADVVMNSSIDIPILAPEIQLLFKAKHTRPKDQADFEQTLPRLNLAQKEWLANALSQHHQDHPWLQAIAERASS